MRYLKHLLLTDTFLIRGHLNNGGQRLSTFLNNTRKRLLEMDEVTCIKHDWGECALSARMLLRMDEILLAHEMEEAGDDGLRLLADQQRDEVAVTAHFTGAIQFQLSGKVSKRTINRCASSRHHFVVVVEPQLRGLTGKAAHECAVFEGLPYVIMNTNRLAFLLQ